VEEVESSGVGYLSKALNLYQFNLRTLERMFVTLHPLNLFHVMTCSYDIMLIYRTLLTSFESMNCFHCLGYHFQIGNEVNQK